jgi:hypothetical protein
MDARCFRKLVLPKGLAPLRCGNRPQMLRYITGALNWWAGYLVIISDAAHKLVAHDGAAPSFVD